MRTAPTQSELLQIAQSGVLAPSADNCHVFKVELADSAIRLWPTREFRFCTDQLRRVLGLISLGAVAENMQLSAGQLGLLAFPRWSLGNQTDPILQLDLQPSDAQSDPLAQAIPARHTNRRMYQGPALEPTEFDLLCSAATAVQGTRVVWLQGTARRRALHLIWLAESERFLRRRLHQDLFASIRFDLDWNESAEVAIPPGALEVEMSMRPAFKALRRWRLMRPLAVLGLHRLLGLRAGLVPCWQAPALGLITTELAQDEGAVAAGTAFERLWLRATLMGLALQPMAASVVLTAQSPGLTEGASQRLLSKLANGWRSIVPDATPRMVFRIGRAKPPTVLSGRPPIASYMVTARQRMAPQGEQPRGSGS